MDIKLKSLIKIDNPEDYKVHFAIFNKKYQPLDKFVEGMDQWEKWQVYKPKGKNVFNRDFIFSLIRYYPKGNDYWLFGGIWEVIERKKKKYVVKLSSLGEELIGRLLLKNKIENNRNIRQKLENHYSNFIVFEILPKKYTGEEFPGIFNIDHSFTNLKSFIKNKDWISALQHIEGIYLITDIKNGKKYVGKADGKKGLLSRWESYLKTGHGGNKDLKKVIIKQGMEYAEENFKFAVLERFREGTSEKKIETREKHWKDVLLSRNKKWGYNLN